ncbi:polysaccharide biosynthesis C-terminal domain-containing protein [Bacillus cereus]|uniref:lipopolysaccharide biosynthesis protein n=1 Tax=Bacillus cereus TaxID=1396 RepID=UPI000B4B5CCC|nr:polysaccharide biosynthesis C-terminal domain-containing protein [Bacillus cereus]MDA2271781.1 polysaccharide biosynthesis C-terminal domain-containing protein [Bacillus cereus]
MQGSSFNKKVGIYFIGMLSSKILSVLLIPIYAFYVSADVLGYYDYTITIMSILIPCVYIAIWEALLRFILSEKNDVTKRVAIATSAIFSLFMTCLLIVGSIVYGNLFINNAKIVPLIVIMFASYGLTNIWQYFARALEENRVYVFAGVIGTIINFVSVVILVCIMELGLQGLFTSYILGQVSILVFIERKVHVRKYINIKYFRIKTLKKMLLFSAPLVLNLISMWLMSAFGRFIITQKIGVNANGLFSFASKFSLIVTMIGSVITMAIIEEAIISAKTKGLDSSFTSKIENVFKVFQSIILVAVPLIVIFYNFIDGTDYNNSMQYAPWLLLYAIANIMSSNLAAVFQVIDKTNYQFITTLIGAVVTVLISYGLISLIGIYAVVIGQIMGGITMMLTRYRLINKYIKFKIAWNPIIGMTILFIVVTLICLNSPLFINVIIFLLVIGVLYYFNLSYVKTGYVLIMNKIGKKRN